MNHSVSTRRQVLAGSACLLIPPLPAMASVCAKSGADLTLLTRTMAHGRFVTYQPTAIAAAASGALTPASDDSIRADLTTLRPHFDGLITYGAKAGNERVPDIAKELGFRAVVMGVWDFNDAEEHANAAAAAARNKAIVAGLSLGNEMVLSKRGTWGDVAHALASFRTSVPGVPLAVTEPFSQFLDDPDAKSAFAGMDFLLANVHPVFEPWFRKATAANWTDFVAKVADRLAASFCGPVLVKETGVPSGPASAHYDETMQHDFWRALEARMKPTASQAFSYFAAFDAPWRAGASGAPEEGHWGLFTAERAPKRVVSDMPPLR